MKKDTIDLEKLDSNCNDCIHQVRDVKRFKESLAQHEEWQLKHFNTLKSRILSKADWWQNKKNPKYNLEKGINLKKEAAKMSFQFDKKQASINFGHCNKFNKEITWIPNTLQLDTQDCFKHRREK